MKESLRYTPAAGAASIPTEPKTTGRGLFIVFEGSDGSGKTTQLELLADALTAAGHTVVTTREPGGTTIGEKLRELVLDPNNDPIDARTETLIFAASRAAHAAHTIRPALEAGAVVLSDRYIDSSAAYQGAGRELGVENVVELSRWATNDLLPDITILLDVPATTRGERMSTRGTSDRIEAENTAFKTRLHTAFSELANHPITGPHKVINGTGIPQQVHQQVLAAITHLLEAPTPKNGAGAKEGAR